MKDREVFIYCFVLLELQSGGTKEDEGHKKRKKYNTGWRLLITFSCGALSLNFVVKSTQKGKKKNKEHKHDRLNK